MAICRPASIWDILGYAVTDSTQDYLRHLTERSREQPNSGENFWKIVGYSLGQTVCEVVKYKINEPLCHHLTSPQSTQFSQPSNMGFVSSVPSLMRDPSGQESRWLQFLRERSRAADSSA